MHRGVRLGFTGPRISHRSRNLRSALDHPDIVRKHLATECARGHTAGPFPRPPCTPFRTSGLGVVPKKSGGHRLIVHLSSPPGASVNDFISRDDFSLQYITVDTVISHLQTAGIGALMFKVDLKHAFRLVPVHPDDWPLLGMEFDGQYYVDKVLPFGLRSSPKLFNRLADALCWIMRNCYGVSTLEHYLDDYIGVCPPSPTPLSSTGAIQMSTVLQVFDNLGVPIADGADKVVGPSSCITVLGIEIDSAAQEMRLPPEKLQSLLGLLRSWSRRSTCTKRELLSLVGSLSFAAKVVPPGRTFLRRLIDFSCTSRHLDQPMSLTCDAMADISWWLDFLPAWNGRALFRDRSWTLSSSFQLFTDASGLGFGGFFQGHWFFWGVATPSL